MELNEFKTLGEDDQIEYITDLEVDEEAHSKWGFFREILLNKDISDLTRIEVLNVLGASHIPLSERKPFIQVILEDIQERTEDETFLCHGIMALQNHNLYSKSVYEIMLGIFKNPKEDEDIRYNAAVIVDNNTEKDILISIYEGFITRKDPHFVAKSKRWIREIEQRET